MTASTTLQLIIQGNTASAVGAVRQLQSAMAGATSEIAKQRVAIAQLQATEAKRSASAKLQFAQKEQQIKLEQAALKNTPSALLAAEKATERVKVAQGALAIASERAKLAQMGVGGAVEEATKSGVSGFVGLNAAMLVVGATVTGLIAGFGQLKNAIEGAVNREVSILGQEQTAIKTLGLNRQQARDYVEDFNKQVAILGRDLPTSSEKISTFARTIQDDYAIALKAAGASVNQIKAATISSSTRIALASEAANTDVGTTNAAIQAFLAGSISSKAGMNQYQFFANNTQLRSELENQLKASGKKGFGEMSALQRIKALDKALQRAFTDEDIKELQGTAKAQIASFTDKLFDPETGLFSIERDLDDKIKGKQSVYTSFKKTLDLLIGDKGVFSTIGKFFNTDPMKMLKSSLDRFNVFLEGFNTSISKLKKFDAVAIGSAVGKFAAQVTNQVFDGVLFALAKVDYGAVIGGAVSGIGSFFANLDWKIYLAGSAALIGAVLVPPILAAVGGAAALIGGAIVAAVGGVPLLIGGAIVLGVVGVSKLIADNWGSVTRTVGGWGKRLSDWTAEFDKRIVAFVKKSDEAINQWVVGAGEMINAGFKWIGDAFTSIFKSAGDAVTGVINSIKDLIGKVVKPLQSAVGSITGAIPNATRAASSTVSSVGSSIGGFFSGIGSFLGGAISSILPKYMGNVPAVSAATGLVDAVITEARNKPLGSQLAIANTSEAILTPNMLSNLIGNTYNSAQNSTRTVNIQPGAIVINSSSGNPNEIADQVLRRLDQLFQSEMDSRLA